jgi:hypothetical protein
MSVKNNVNEVLHRIRVKLYPNYLPGVDGSYVARTNSEASLTIEQVCAALKNRGGFTGNYEDLTEYVRQFFDEAAYQLADGFAVNMKYFSVHPNVGGMFSSVNEPHKHEKHPIAFRFRARSALHRIVEHIAVDIEGLADTAGWIDEYYDPEAESVNTLYVPGNQFIIHGHKIKVAGNNPGVGVYFVPAEDPSKAVKVTRIAENSPSKIIGIAPQVNNTHNRIEIRTQFGGSSTKFLKTPHSITSGFVLEES